MRGWSLVIPQEKLTVASLTSTVGLILPEKENWEKKMEEFLKRDSLELIVGELDRLAT